MMVRRRQTSKAVIRQRRSREARALDRRYVEGYLRKPEDVAWGETGAKLLARRLPREKW
ncbi:MAG: hypothetical protein HYY64_14565 [Candidatus Rokubacteria bacterium]|nr:hypothetical protein [Candidatus Rokubacteria bacterium]